MALIPVKRLQQSMFEGAATANRFQGSGGGGGMQPMQSLGFAAAGGQGNYATANSSTWTDITNTSFTIVISRSIFIDYRIFATAHISAGAQTGYIRGNIVGFDTSASLFFAGAAATNGFIWYFPITPGPITAGTYLVKLQAATDANTTTITVDQFFHQIFFLGS